MKLASAFWGALLAPVLLAACGAGAVAQSGPPADHPRADQWTIGPIIDGRDYSRAVPLHPVPGPAGAWHIDLPQAPGSLHYVTFRHGPLAGRTRIVMRYRIDAEPGVRIVPATAPDLPSVITLYFQRGGDDWSGEGRFEAYRWYATFASQRPIVPGVHEMAAPLNGDWTAVERSSARNNPAAFRAALAAADRVGFVLGGGSGYGHGIYATGRARLTMLDFRVE
ncbi:MAG TPA: hypothetical protein VFW19_09175 [Allosphingosinicella sp.]|nr:hypothetical protein [Allosphingosinicella sp.]